jgi:integrase
MPANASLKPRRIQSRLDVGKAPWCLNVPCELSPTGKRQRLFYTTERDAKVEAERLRARADNFGVSLIALTPARIAEAAEAYRLLEPIKVELLAAVRGYISLHKQRTESIPFLEACNLYISAKSSKDPRHLKGLRNTRDRFPLLHDKLLSDIDHRALELLVNEVPAGGRNLIIRHLRSFWNFAIRKGYATVNPADRLDFVETKRKEVEVIEPDAVTRMLEQALAEDLQLVPFLTIGFFTGIRPEELSQLNWNDIDLASKEITVRSSVSKTGTRRFPPLSDNALVWLEAYRQAGGRMEGPIINLKEDALYAHRQKNRSAAGVTDWPHDAMRHSFASYWLVKQKDVNRLREILGHEGNTRTLWRHYYRGASKTEAEKFWNIHPSRLAQNVIAFKQTA